MSPSAMASLSCALFAFFGFRFLLLASEPVGVAVPDAAFLSSKLPSPIILR